VDRKTALASINKLAAKKTRSSIPLSCEVVVQMKMGNPGVAIFESSICISTVIVEAGIGLQILIEMLSRNPVSFMLSYSGSGWGEFTSIPFHP